MSSAGCCSANVPTPSLLFPRAVSGHSAEFREAALELADFPEVEDNAEAEDNTG